MIDSGHNVSYKSDPFKTSCAKSLAQSMLGQTMKNSHIAECIKDDGRGQLKVHMTRNFLLAYSKELSK